MKRVVVVVFGGVLKGGSSRRTVELSVCFGSAKFAMIA